MQMLVLAISSQKNTLNGILSKFRMKKGCIFFGQKWVISAIVQQKTRQNKQQTAQSFFCEITTA